MSKYTRGRTIHGIDKKKFRPHITLIRKVLFKEGALMNSFEDIKVKDTLVERISLMRSERGKNGMIYTEIGKIYND